MGPQPVERRTLPLSAYAQELRNWLQLTRQYQMSNSFHQSCMLNAAYLPPPTTVDSGSSSTQSAASTGPTGNNNQQPQTFPVSAGAEVKIPTIWKRAAAEVIDSILLLCVKFAISYMLITIGGFKAVQILDFDYALANGELDVEKFLSFSSEIVFVEFLHKLFVSFYEAFCLTYVTNIIPAGGFTPGKKLMGLAVIGCDEVFSLGNDRFLVTGMRNPSLSSTVCRSLIKNLSLSLMMPTCLTIFMFDHKRTAYDLLTRTVVIELAN